MDATHTPAEHDELCGDLHDFADLVYAAAGVLGWTHHPAGRQPWAVSRDGIKLAALPVTDERGDSAARVLLLDVAPGAVETFVPLTDPATGDVLPLDAAAATLADAFATHHAAHGAPTR